MRISNCKGCGRIFNVLSDEQYCPNCQKKMDEKFDIVKRFVEDNPFFSGSSGSTAHLTVH